MQDPNISHMSIKPPPFYKRNPDMWFTQMESQFILSGIKNENTKYHHIISTLPEDIASDLLLSSNENKSYEDLKQQVLSNLKANKHQLIEEALQTVEMGSRRPTQVMCDIKRKFSEVGLTVDDSIVKSRLISALPSSIRAALVGHDQMPLEDFAKVADSMVAVMTSTTPYASVNEAAVQQQRNPNQQQFNNSTARPFHANQRPKICSSHIYYASVARTCRP